MNKLIKLTPEKFQEIYSNKRLRNEVAFCHGSIDSSGKFKHYQTCGYPTSYIVTEEQIEEAKKLVEYQKQETIETNKGKLLFVGMGMEIEGEELNNHRFRTRFFDDFNRLCFIEFSRGIEKADGSVSFYVTHSIRDYGDGRECNNFGNLERKACIMPTQKAILSCVNNVFCTSFKEMFIDKWDTDTKDFICRAEESEVKA